MGARTGWRSRRLYPGLECASTVENRMDSSAQPVIAVAGGTRPRFRYDGWGDGLTVRDLIGRTLPNFGAVRHDPVGARRAGRG
jgi:hypothetical protein